MNPEGYIIAGIIISLIFTELTGLSPGGIIVPGYMALFLHKPAEILLTVICAAGVMVLAKLASRFFFFFGRRRYAFCLLLGILLKLGIEYFSPGFSGSSFNVFPVSETFSNMRIIGWLIPGIFASDMYKQGIPRTL